MRRFAILALVMGFGLCFVANVWADSASKEECIAKCREAAALIKKDKTAAIAEVNKKDGKFVWKDTYVFVMDMNGKMLAHPMSPALLAKPSLLEMTDKNTEEPKKIFVEFINIAKDKGEGWMDYMWPKPGEEKPSVKQTYVLRVQGTDMLVGAGVYK